MHQANRGGWMPRLHAYGLALLMLVTAMAPAWASSSLEFDGGGYVVAMEVGDDTAPSIARVRFHAPGDAEGVAVSSARLTVSTFDTARQRLSLRCRGDGARLPAFELVVRGTRAELVVDGKRIAAPFQWER